jgi:hypothetical protein
MASRAGRNERGPAPLAPGEADRFLDRLETGESWKRALERALLELPAERGGRLMQLLREGRGAFLPLLAAPTPASRALLVGNALSGTAVALARAGWALVVVDPEPQRLALARARDAALARGAVQFVAGGGRALPFAAGSFDLVVQELGPTPPGFSHGPAELARLARGQVFWVADNRLAYKRSRGARADFRLARPAELLAGLIAPRRGERSLTGYRRALGEVLLERAEAFALYPHREDFSHVVALDAPWPALTVGPKERGNRLKLLGWRLGLFPRLAPSFGLLARSRGAEGRARWIEQALAAIAERTQEPIPAAQYLVATRGNTALVLTAVPGAHPEDPRGRWALHVPLSPQQEVQARRHIEHLGLLRTRFPGLPVPEPLFDGTVAGSYLTAERRLGGLTAPQLSGDQEAARRTYRDTLAHFASLVVAGPEPIGEDLFERFFAAKFELVARHAGRLETARAIEALQKDLRTRLDGLPLPLVFQHADLRAKHVQVTPTGEVLGYLDWGSSELQDLPWFDLAHLLAHDRKQESGRSAGWAWGLLRDGGLREFEQRALDELAERQGLVPELVAALAEAYPVLVGAMAEKNWDYSRPRWVHESFGL